VSTSQICLDRWYKNTLLVEFPASLRSYIDYLNSSSQTSIVATYVPDEKYDYLETKFNGNFSSSLMPEAWEAVEKARGLWKS